MHTFGVKCRWRKIGVMTTSTGLHRRRYVLPESVFNDASAVVAAAGVAAGGANVP